MYAFLTRRFQPRTEIVILVPPKKLYVVHEGAIYEAQTSDRGRTYHGYPYKVSCREIYLRSSQLWRTGSPCSELFAIWVKTHIDRYGVRR